MARQRDRSAKAKAPAKVTPARMAERQPEFTKTGTATRDENGNWVIVREVEPDTR